MYVGSSADLVELENETIGESDETGVIGGAVWIDERPDVFGVLPVNVWRGARADGFPMARTDGELLVFVLFKGDFCGCPGGIKNCVPLSAERDDLTPDEGSL